MNNYNYFYCSLYMSDVLNIYDRLMLDGSIISQDSKTTPQPTPDKKERAEQYKSESKEKVDDPEEKIDDPNVSYSDIYGSGVKYYIDKAKFATKNVK